MFVEGTSWRKKLVGMTLMYVLFLALGLMYASRIFHDHALWSDGLLIFAALSVLAVGWFLYRKMRDPEFAARAAQRKANPAQGAKAASNAAPLYVILFHI